MYSVYSDLLKKQCFFIYNLIHTPNTRVASRYPLRVFLWRPPFIVYKCRFKSIWTHHLLFTSTVYLHASKACSNAISWQQSNGNPKAYICCIFKLSTLLFDLISWSCVFCENFKTLFISRVYPLRFSLFHFVLYLFIDFISLCFVYFLLKRINRWSPYRGEINHNIQSDCIDVSLFYNSRHGHVKSSVYTVIITKVNQCCYWFSPENMLYHTYLLS